MDNENKYNIIFEELQNRVDSGELTIEDAEIINDLAYDKYFVEKKTREQYRIDSFKKKYNFKPDKPGAKTGTITVNGEDYPVDFNKGNTSITGYLVGTDGNIIISDDFFKLKGSKKNERRDAILNHEIGHIKLHSLNPDNTKLDKSKMSSKTYEKITDSLLRLNDRDPDYLSKKDKKELLGEDYKPLKYTLKSLSNSKKQQSERDESWKNAEKYGGKKIGSHLNAMEIEADRYAANKTSSSAVKKGLRNLYTVGKRSLSDQKKFVNTLNKEIRSNLKDSGETGEYKKYKINKGTFSDEQRKLLKKSVNITRTSDYNARSKALKDKKLIQSKVYK